MYLISPSAYVAFWRSATVDHVMYWKFGIRIEEPIVKIIIIKILFTVHPVNPYCKHTKTNVEEFTFLLSQAEYMMYSRNTKYFFILYIHIYTHLKYIQRYRRHIRKEIASLCRSVRRLCLYGVRALEHGVRVVHVSWPHAQVRAGRQAVGESDTAVQGHGGGEVSPGRPNRPFRECVSSWSNSERTG